MKNMGKPAKLIVLFICFILCNNYGYAQNDSNALKKPLNNVGINLLGNGSILSINYERLFVVNDFLVLSANTGVGVNYEFSMLSRMRRYIVFPQNISTNWRIGNRGSLEIGMGGSIYYSDYNNWPVLYYPVLGYRHQPLKPNRLGFKLSAYLPIINKEYPTLFYPVGFTLMYSF